MKILINPETAIRLEGEEHDEKKNMAVDSDRCITAADIGNVRRNYTEAGSDRKEESYPGGSGSGERSL